MFGVDDVDAAAKGYPTPLEARLQQHFPENPPFQWVSLLLEDMELMIAQRKAAQAWYTPRVRVSTIRDPFGFVRVFAEAPQRTR